jgi:hypothetical protein
MFGFSLGLLKIEPDGFASLSAHQALSQKMPSRKALLTHLRKVGLYIEGLPLPALMSTYSDCGQKKAQRRDAGPLSRSTLLLTACWL